MDAEAAHQAETRGRELMELTFRAEDAQSERIAADTPVPGGRIYRCAQVMEEAEEANDRQRMRLAKLTAGIDEDLPPPPPEELIMELRDCAEE